MAHGWQRQEAAAALASTAVDGLESTEAANDHLIRTSQTPLREAVAHLRRLNAAATRHTLASSAAAAPHKHAPSSAVILLLVRSRMVKAVRCKRARQRWRAPEDSIHVLPRSRVVKAIRCMRALQRRRAPEDAIYVLPRLRLVIAVRCVRAGKINATPAGPAVML